MVRGGGAVFQNLGISESRYKDYMHSAFRVLLPLPQAQMLLAMSMTAVDQGISSVYRPWW